LWGIVGAAALVGCTCAVGLTLVLTLPALLVAPEDVPRMSAGMFTIGYGIAMLISIVSGMVWDFTGNAAFAFVPIGLAVVPMIVFPLMIDLRTQRS
jgi:CP family cyanate transporter-like MFS transporter